MNKVEMKAIQFLSAIAREMSAVDINSAPKIYVDAQGMCMVLWKFDEDAGAYRLQTKGWFFKHGGWSANRRIVRDIRQWCAE